MRKFFFLAVLFLSFFIQSPTTNAAVGILESAEKAGITLTCPDGVVNCEEVNGVAVDYSVTGTQNFILKLIGGLLNFAALIAVVMLIVVALRLVTARGSQDALAAAKKQITWTIAGLFAIILSLLIVKNITEKVYKITEPPEPVVAAEEPLAVALDCKTLGVDGLLGPATAAARIETPNLAQSFV